MCTIFETKTVHLSWTNLFWYKQLLLSSFCGPFHCAKLKKKITVDPELCLCTIFGPKVVHLPQIRIFFRKPNNESCLFFLFLFFLKIITIILIYLLTLFFVQNLKKLLPADPELWKMCNLWAHSGPFISPNENLFRKPVNEPYYFYSCLSTCQISKSGINLLVKY